MDTLFISRAGNGTRTRDPDLGKVVLYQLSYSRKWIANIVRKNQSSKPKLLIFQNGEVSKD